MTILCITGLVSFYDLLHDNSLYHGIGVILYSCYMTIPCVAGLVLFCIPVTQQFFMYRIDVI